MAGSTGATIASVSPATLERGKMTSRYDRLAEHLAGLDAPVITLTFAEIEAIVGPLPGEARRTNPSWWGTTPRARYRHPHTRYWRAAGYQADRPDLAAETVTFRRVQG
jgi:hypothetical protein